MSNHKGLNKSETFTAKKKEVNLYILTWKYAHEIVLNFLKSKVAE